MTRASVLSGIKQQMKSLLGAQFTPTANATKYYMVTGYSGAGSSYTSATIRMALSGIFKNLVVKALNAPGAGQTVGVTLNKNNADTALTCLLSGATQTEASDLTHEVAVAVGDLITFKVIGSATATVSTTSAGLTFMER